METQAPRISVTVSYDGIVVGGLNSYHPEKVGYRITKTIDFVDGESQDQLVERITQLDSITELITQRIESELMEKVASIKANLDTNNIH